MNQPTSSILRQFLDLYGLGSMPSASGTWPIFVTTLPDGRGVDDDCLAVLDTAGQKDGRIMDGEVIMKRGVQILVRSKTNSSGWRKSEAVARRLDLVRNESVTISTDTFKLLSITRRGDILQMGQEEGTKQRWLFSINCLVSLQSQYP